MAADSGVRGMIFTASCDASRRLYDMAVKYIPRISSHMLDIPRHNSLHSIAFFEKELKKLIIFLERLSRKKMPKVK